MSRKKKLIKELAKLKKEIIKSYKPEKIILFGSLAWGRVGPDSDIDLMVIKKSKKRPSERFNDFAKKVDTMVDAPKDIIIFTPGEIKKRLSIEDDFILDVIERGKVLYEKK